MVSATLSALDILQKECNMTAKNNETLCEAISSSPVFNDYEEAINDCLNKSYEYFHNTIHKSTNLSLSSYFFVTLKKNMTGWTYICSNMKEFGAKEVSYYNSAAIHKNCLCIKYNFHPNSEEIITRRFVFAKDSELYEHFKILGLSNDIHKIKVFIQYAKLDILNSTLKKLLDVQTNNFTQNIIENRC